MTRKDTITTKFTSMSKQSGEVTAELIKLNSPSSNDAYSRIQITEATTVSAAMTSAGSPFSESIS